MQTLYAYMDYMDTERWQAILRTGAELAADELTTDPDRQFDDDTRVRLAAVLSPTGCAEYCRVMADNDSQPQ